jgi:ABC-type glycerol-3-phosphate transport system substrate-binding protein
MKKAIKIFALLLALMMMVTMAAACKKADDQALIGGGSTGIGNTGTNTGDGTANNGDGTTNNGGDNTNQGGGTNSAPPAQNEEQQQIAQNYDGTQKYDPNANPLLSESKKINTGSAPSYNLDSTGFVKGNIKIADLKGKTVTLITGIGYGNFIYNGPNGEELNEWTWFDSMKKTYGLNVKYIESRFDKAPQIIITYMNSGKALDLFNTHRAGFPQYLLISGALDPYVNKDYIKNSPGIDQRTLDQMKWDGTYRAIAPLGCVDVIWYNETMVKSFGMEDPHTLWKQGKWDWAAFEKFFRTTPKLNANNQSLGIFSISEGDAWNFWARSNGINVFDIKTENGKSKIVSNFADPKAVKSYTWFAGLNKGYNSGRGAGTGDPLNDMYTKGTHISSNTNHLMRDYTCAYSKTQKFNWVPYPYGPDNAAKENYCMNFGDTMMIPKKTKNTANVPIAIKFAEIWASRFTEAIFDNLQRPYYGFTHADRAEYFKFTTSHNYFAVGTRIFELMTGNDKEYYNRFIWSFYNPNWNTATQVEQLIPLVDKAVKLTESYGK